MILNTIFRVIAYIFNIHTGRQIDGWTDGESDRQTDRQMDRQTVPCQNTSHLKMGIKKMGITCLTIYLRNGACWPAAIARATILVPRHLYRIQVSATHLPHLPLDKMAVISQTTFSNAFSWTKIVKIWIKISLKFVPMGLIDSKWALVQVMAWCRSGDKPLSGPMLTQFTDIYMWH